MKRLDTFRLGFLAFCAALNVGVGAVVGVVKLPFYLDSIGTIIATALGGWVYGFAVGALALIISSVAITPTAPAYMGTALLIAVCTSVLVRFGFLRSLVMTIVGGLLIGVVAAIASAPVTTYLYGGVSLAGTDAITAFFRASGNTLLESVIFGGLSADPIDKLVTSLIAGAVLKAMPKRIYLRFPNGKFFAGNSSNKLGT